jgi:hypothetical protein
MPDSLTNRRDPLRPAEGTSRCAEAPLSRAEAPLSDPEAIPQGRERRPRIAGAQKLGGVMQNRTRAGPVPWFTFQCGTRDGYVIASPSRRT